MLGEQDLHLFNEGTHRYLHRHLGAHIVERDGRPGTWFGVWAPSAREVSVIGDFNGWSPDADPLQPRGGSGIWEGWIDGVGHGSLYKYRIVAPSGRVLEKADPMATFAEVPPNTASVVWDLDHEWSDARWMSTRGERAALDAPISIYEMHIGSWGRAHAENGRFPTYRELARPLADHLEAHGFTHVELLPVMEHPFYGSWGYQGTGYFAPTSRYGTPQDLMAMVDHLHQRGLGVIVDWVPSHFPADAHGLGQFDGTHLYEHEDRRLGHHPDWDSLIFNYGRHEVRAFLISSAISWLDRYHIDGIRVDAVASMLYRDYSRKEGEWIPNEYGGRENLEAIGFLREMNTAIFGEFPDVTTFAEESTAWPMVSRPTYVGGLGFGFKWDMGWMHDTLQHFQRDPIHRHHHYHELTFRGVYYATENYTLPLSHDEVVHGKGSLLAKMPGDRWRQLANLRLLYAYQWAQPGKKLLFMGGEVGQLTEWSHEGSVDWSLLDDPGHAGISRLLGDLNGAYRSFPSLHQKDCDADGFRWVEASDTDNDVLAFLRLGEEGEDPVLAVFNLTPVVRDNYRLGVPRAGYWREVVNTDAEMYGGSGVGNLGGAESVPVPSHGEYHSVVLTLPPLGALFLVPGNGTA
ncbi:1,4-alpha-glucan branching protein GlgB [Actinomarinicola tropica]|uniref:1,4-alpha-glucan branching enzyme GlgB n=2 Tax=Actinomarinicola tropica TaxID=2789776 RepID=A0A5Q2RSI7_9ACTN|nr:1,4-alpha-glucan branching protein GlgB [Actinomarinicola tropica]